jgi:hypothetical protein
VSDSLNVLKFKRNLKKVIRIFVWDTWILVQSFKIINFKSNLKKGSRISVFGTLRIVENF